MRAHLLRGGDLTDLPQWDPSSPLPCVCVAPCLHAPPVPHPQRVHVASAASASEVSPVIACTRLMSHRKTPLPPLVAPKSGVSVVGDFPLQKEKTVTKVAIITIELRTICIGSVGKLRVTAENVLCEVPLLRPSTRLQRISKLASSNEN